MTSITKRHKSPKIAVVIGVGVVVIVMISVLSVVAVCGADIPDTVVAEDLSAFMRSGQNKAHELVLEAEQTVRTHIGLVARVGSGSWTSAEYQCDGQQCRLLKLYTEVGQERYITCRRRNPGNVQTTQFAFDLETNRVTAKTFEADAGPAIVGPQLSTISPTIDDALIQGLALFDPKIRERNPYLRVIITPQFTEDHWDVVVSDLNGTQETKMIVAYKSS